MTAKPFTRFQPGKSGNPKGRPVGSRNKVTIAVENSATPNWIASRPS
ncbi:DUF5681 domain-containing protein [Mesorhizobium sp. ANAO-SY3R2]